MAKKKNKKLQKTVENEYVSDEEPEHVQEKVAQIAVSSRSAYFWHFLQFYHRVEQITVLLVAASNGHYFILAPSLTAAPMIFTAAVKTNEEAFHELKNKNEETTEITTDEQSELESRFPTAIHTYLGEDEPTGLWYKQDDLEKFETAEEGTKQMEDLLRKDWNRLAPHVRPKPCPNNLKKVNRKDFKAVKFLGSFGNYEISHVQFSENEELGLPQFGMMKKVTLKAPAKDHVKLIDESLVQISCAGPHVLKIIGSSYFNGTAIFTEVYASSLHCYLIAKRGELGQSVKLRWSIEAAEALGHMNRDRPDILYLFSSPYLHRNVRATNFYLTTDLTLKIGNFEYATNICLGQSQFEYDYDKSLTRWLPPETLIHKKYNRESEVFSFGVLVWQIYNEGKEPYAGMRNYEVKMKWMNKWRKCQKDRKFGLKMPMMCPQLIRDLTKSCWNSCDCCGNRPSIGEILKKMKQAYQEWMSV